MSIARIIALGGIGLAIVFLLIITIQYFVSVKKNKDEKNREEREGNQDSTYDD